MVKETFAPGIQASSETPRFTSSRWIRSEFKTILRNPESRKIFYFLVLNVSYMLIQMLYGVWTNSLGLISDAIHMAFDCMAIGVGLFASIMATWPPNERFTYGYGRIETLSGFANGIFLILISIFIVFEAIQRLLEPPEMNTGQLLLVSTLGLCVNLFGMFAMGGHHHHAGHSHSHGHSHLDHSDSIHHSHSHPNSNSPIEETREANPHSKPCSPSHLEISANARHDLLQISLNEKARGHNFHGPPINTSGGEQHSDIGRHNKDYLSVIPAGDYLSPITPSYHFGHDDHFRTHHKSDHAPNLHDHSHSHSHDRSHEGHSHNMRGVFLHVMADTLGSVGVILSTLLIQFYGWTGFDPIASLFIAVLIAVSVIPLVVDTGKVLALDVADREASIHEALSELVHIPGLASYRSARFWPKDASSLIGSIHIHLAPPSATANGNSSVPAQPTMSELDRAVERVDTFLRGRISGLEELTIQAERLGD